MISAQKECQLTLERLREVLDYNAETGEFTWLVAQGKRTDIVGQKAGYCGRGYLTIRIDYEIHFAHRLAWLYVYGRWPEGYLDHANGDPSNNRIANLRECSQQQNIRNGKLRRNSTSGIIGVSWNKTARKWRAHITIAGKLIDLGYYAIKEDARRARLKAEHEMFGEFAPSRRAA